MTLPHRPAAFPSQLFAPLALPVSGLLLPFSSFLNTSDPKGTSESPSNPVDFVADATSGSQTTGTSAGSYGHSPEYGCIPPSLPPRYSIPPAPWKIALVERGQCDFASKVRAAQERGAAGVVVGDGKLRESETDEEGRKRESLITMFSPGTSFALDGSLSAQTDEQKTPRRSSSLARLSRAPVTSCCEISSPMGRCRKATQGCGWKSERGQTREREFSEPCYDRSHL